MIDVVMVTNNERDFINYPGVKLESWLNGHEEKTLRTHPDPATIFMADAPHVHAGLIKSPPFYQRR